MIYTRRGLRAETRSRMMLYSLILVLGAPIAVYLQGSWISRNEDMFTGSFLMRLQTQRIKCDRCGGLGTIRDPASPERSLLCPICYGMGGHYVRKLDKKDVLCPLCGGDGRILDEKTGTVRYCPRCDGRGLIRTAE